MKSRNVARVLSAEDVLFYADFGNMRGPAGYLVLGSWISVLGMIHFSIDTCFLRPHSVLPVAHTATINAAVTRPH